SVLYNKVENTGVYGGQMPPPPNPALAQSDIQLIMDWINEGAQQGGGQGGTIEGTVSSNESVTGDLWVGLFEPTADPNYWIQRSTESFLGNYVFPVSNINFIFQEPFIIDGDGYFVMAFVDENFNGTPDPFELLGMSPSVMVTGGYGNTGDIFMTFGAGGGFSFDFGDTGGYAETNFNVLDGGPQITMEMFIKLHRSYGPGEYYELIGRDSWAYLEYDGDTGEFYFGLEGIGDIEWQHSPNPGGWHHLAADYDGVNMTIYWDGEMKASVATGGGNLLNFAPPDMQIGEGFDGLADVIRISDIALYYPNNFDPWAQDYNPNASTFLLYHCNEGSGNQLKDDSGHEHHAIITGNPTWDTDEPLGPVGEGRIAGNVTLNEEWAPAQVYMGLWFPGKNPDFDPPDLSLKWGEDPPFSVSYEFIDVGIQQGGPYTVGAFFDANGNGSLDGDEPQGEKGNLNVPASNELMGVDFVLSSQPGGHVEGNIHSGESASGTLIIGLFEPGNSSEWTPDFELVNPGISFPPNFFYAFDDPGIYDASGWEVRAFLDKDDDYWPESDEMRGASGMFQISGGSAYGIDFDLFPPGVGPQIGVSTTQLNFVENEGTLEFQVGNLGQDVLYWEIYVEYDSSGTLDWITSIDPSEGSSTSPDEDNITIIITPTGFEEAAEIYVDGYSDPDYNNWIGDWLIEVHLDPWIAAAPPEITGNLGGITAIENNSILIQVRIVAEAGLERAELKYVIGGDQTSKTSQFVNTSGDNYEATIPSGDVTSRGLIGFIEVMDSLNRVTFSDTSEVRVGFNSISLLGTSPERYVMISVPGDLNNKNAQPILFEEYDNTQIRLFRWKNNGYQEYPSIDKLDPGKAFWIITLDATTLMGGSGTSTRLIPSYTINLDQGWNQIGTPYNFGNGINDLIYTPGSIEPTFYEYDGSGYSTTNMMDPGKGYWLYAHEATSIKVNPRGPGLAKLMVEGVPHPLNWGGRVKASTGNVNDSENVFGVILSASETWDEFDRHEPPVIGDYITLAFDNRNWESRGGLYAQDIQPEGMEGYLWQFVVKTNQEGYVNLDVEKIKELPPDWDLFVLDMDLKIVHKAQEMNQYRFVSTGSEIERNFSLVVGPDSFTKEVMKDYNFVPTDYTLLQNVPNPFNAITTIRFGLPEDGKVSLTIYSILGQKVAAVISEQEFTTGSHAILWDGKNDAGRGVATGVYLYYLTVRKDGVTKFHQARKLVLLK
ncbi:MAG: hypothetical protein IID16_11770, partial [Candidatus Marinimicrobia bacterium]|nr:hypothetical protein [Candidatus Neomarinimicrobiota bacterium]